METIPSHTSDVRIAHEEAKVSALLSGRDREKIFSSPNNQADPLGPRANPCSGQRNSSPADTQQAAAPGPAFANRRYNIIYVTGSLGPV